MLVHDAKLLHHFHALLLYCLLCEKEHYARRVDVMEGVLDGLIEGGLVGLLNLVWDGLVDLVGNMGSVK